MVSCHPAASAGTNAVVLGFAAISKEEGGCAPSESKLAFVHLMVLVSAVPSSRTPITRNVAVVGNLKHACGAVMIPRSNDHNPPGVFG